MSREHISPSEVLRFLFRVTEHNVAHSDMSIICTEWLICTYSPLCYILYLVSGTVYAVFTHYTTVCDIETVRKCLSYKYLQLQLSSGLWPGCITESLLTDLTTLYILILLLRFLSTVPSYDLLNNVTVTIGCTIEGYPIVYIAWSVMRQSLVHPVPVWCSFLLG